MYLQFLGTCSGTEPQPGRHHASVVLVVDERLLWFDAGETCSHTAYVQGLDILNLEAVFLSHAHLDHTGGLPNLLWTVRKLEKRREDQRETTIPVFTPSMVVWDAVTAFAGSAAKGQQTGRTFSGKQVQDGLLYSQDGVVVKALHNAHIQPASDAGPWSSFSYRIEVRDKAVVYSGDFRDIEELAPILDDLDVLLVETGHHKVETICSYLAARPKRPGMVIFTHHGRAILADVHSEMAKAREYLGDSVLAASDGMVLPLDS